MVVATFITFADHCLRRFPSLAMQVLLSFRFHGGIEFKIISYDSSGGPACTASCPRIETGSCRHASWCAIAVTELSWLL
jgi:hypothetical protein